MAYLVFHVRLFLSPSPTLLLSAIDNDYNKKCLGQTTRCPQCRLKNTSKKNANAATSSVEADKSGLFQTVQAKVTVRTFLTFLLPVRERPEKKVADDNDFAAVDTETLKLRAWDDWKDDNPRGRCQVISSRTFRSMVL